ncbi:MAG: metallophosphoesterase family protein [Pirellulales bacterium]
MLTLLHISDLHFGPHFIPVVGEALVRSATDLNPDLIVASGDFTQRAKPGQFAAAREYLDRLPRVPTVVVPGNHDVPLYRLLERLFAPYANYQKYISGELDTVLIRDDVAIVALNTTAAWTKIVNGRVTHAQLDFCARAFRDVPDLVPRIVVAHHHFAPAPDYDDKHDVLRRARQALDRFTELQVDMILGGHLHRAFIGNSLDIYPSKDRSAGIIVVQSGTTTSQRGRAREREKNSFNLIQIEARTVHVTHHMYFSELGGFAPVSRHEFPRRECPYLGGAQ